MEFKGPKLTTKLICQAPMIHFQHYEKGVTLRASEVKPKFDRYIKAKESWEKVPMEFRADKDHEALNYKMRFVDEDVKWDSIDDILLYYGNDFSSKIRRDEDFQEGIRRQKQDKVSKHLISSNPTLIITCFNAKLQEKIIEHLENFFIVTNFGTMQGKGFGSFVLQESIEQVKLDKNYYEKAICENLELASDLYVMDASKYNRLSQQDRLKKIFEEIKTFYQLTKSGLNYPFRERNIDDYGQKYKKGYLFKYMLESGFKNEKALVKNKKIIRPFMRVQGNQDIQHRYMDNIDEQILNNPVDIEKYNRQQQEDITPDESRYVRALLGIGAQLNFINQDERKRLKNIGTPRYQLKNFEKESTVIIGSKLFERMSSPLQFKIIGNKIYILAKTIPNEIFDKSFEFKNGLDTNNSVKVLTPSKSEFDFADFIKKAIAYYQGTLETTVNTEESRRTFYKPLPITVYPNNHKREVTNE